MTFQNTQSIVIWRKKFLKSMHRDKSAKMAKSLCFPNSHFGSFVPVHRFQKFLSPNDFWLSVLKGHLRFSLVLNWSLVCSQNDLRTFFEYKDYFMTVSVCVVVIWNMTMLVPWPFYNMVFHKLLVFILWNVTWAGWLHQKNQIRSYSKCKNQILH